ncbi:hypothetical protein AX14_003992 [Amanita brunnescens Koide BX004]|nr:hypothetical protein AX14_003992 [Amanita brunnescens Koide BX004]
MPTTRRTRTIQQALPILGPPTIPKKLGISQVELVDKVETFMGREKEVGEELAEASLYHSDHVKIIASSGFKVKFV